MSQNYAEQYMIESRIRYIVLCATGFHTTKTMCELILYYVILYQKVSYYTEECTNKSHVTYYYMQVNHILHSPCTIKFDIT
jgi:hypothetical protein